MRGIMTIIKATIVGICLFLEKLVAHGKEGDGQAGSEEDDEVEGQLVPGSERAFQACAMCIEEIARGRYYWSILQFTIWQFTWTDKNFNAPVVDGEGQVVAWCREAITSSPLKITCFRLNIE